LSGFKGISKGRGFTTGLKQLKAVPEDSLSPTSGLSMEPTSTMSPFTPLFTKGSVESKLEEISGRKASGPIVLGETIEKPSPPIEVGKPPRRTRPKLHLMLALPQIQMEGSPSHKRKASMG